MICKRPEGAPCYALLRCPRSMLSPLRVRKYLWPPESESKESGVMSHVG